MLSLQKYTGFTIALLSITFILGSCSGTKKATSADNLLHGTWKLSSAIIDGTDVDTEMLGGEILFVFSATGKATYALPNGVSESNRYSVKDNKIYNEDVPDEAPIEIVSLLTNQLVVRLLEDGKPVVMNLLRMK